MEPLCHRCGENLVPNEIFCPHCGSPQLRVEEADTLPAAQEGSLQQSLERAADMMRWRAAIVAALTIALPVALLSTVVDFDALWVFLGGFFTVSLYQRRTASHANGRIGWRIGGLMGVIAAIFWLALSAASSLLQRYGMHRQPLVVSILEKSIHTSIATVTQQNPSFTKELPWFAHFWLSPDGLASLYLILASITAVSMVLFSALGGALSGIFQRNRPPQNNGF
jgi:hypothetical protein